MTEEAQADPGQVNLKRVLLSELGPRLPLGVVGPDGAPSKDLAVRPWRMKEERELGALRDSNKNANLAEYVSMVLGTMCQRLGSHDFESSQLKPEQKQLAIGQMFVGDVFYAYVWLRVQSLGPHLILNLSCPRCNHKIDGFAANLETVEVETAETLADAQWEYDLKNPIAIRSERVAKFLLGPPRWNAMEMVRGGGLGVAKPAMLKASIHGIGGKDDHKPAMLTDTDLDELSKRDIEAMINQINRFNVGPNMSVEGDCPQCKYNFRMAIDWGYDSFFGDSSR